ncbi:hypothetical protein NP493_289g01010 [Ridgeia piscesae]|uniref:Uncharacterized protein n=1 Tax=Ridgeia piscesae TaxID=27915 RepID=A0AAD9UBH2_RIDPI|nr:hypothetical protein NP493_289g01010 [Ridgeia piscesae]
MRHRRLKAPCLTVNIVNVTGMLSGALAPCNRTGLLLISPPDGAWRVHCFALSRHWQLSTIMLSVGLITSRQHSCCFISTFGENKFSESVQREHYTLHSTCVVMSVVPDMPHCFYFQVQVIGFVMSAGLSHCQGPKCDAKPFDGPCVHECVQQHSTAPLNLTCLMRCRVVYIPQHLTLT